MTEKFILEEKYSSILLKTSIVFGINSLYGFYNYIYYNMECVDVLINNTILFFTSINYWRKPVKGLRRNIDMSLV